jgi:hypothetical protein
MFVSLPEFQFSMPVGLAPPGACYWRTLTTTTNSAWFVIKVKVAVGNDVDLQTLLFWWDTDVVDAVDQLQPLSIESLICVLPVRFDPDEVGITRSPCIVLKEIWQARDADNPDMNAVLFVDEHGRELSGLFAEVPSSPLTKLRLVGRVAGFSASGAGH